MSSVSPTIKRAFLDTPEGQVHYRIGGNGNPLVLLHQTPRSSDSTYGELMPLLAQDRLVIAMDTPGYGDSFKPQRDYSVEDYAGIVLMLLDSLNIERASIMGHHTGSFIAIEAAAAFPQRVDSLVLSFPLPLLDYEERQKGMQAIQHYRQFQMKQDGSHLSEIWQDFQKRVVPHGPLELVNRMTMDSIKASTGSDPTSAFPAVFAYPMEQRLPLIKCPTLILWGMEDLKIHNKDWGFHAIENKDKIGELVPLSRTMVFKGPQSTAAMLNYMAPQIAQIVLGFLAEPGI